LEDNVQINDDEFYFDNFQDNGMIVSIRSNSKDNTNVNPFLLCVLTDQASTFIKHYRAFD